MFDVLYALFGGIFLLGRYTYDKIKTDCARADYNTLKNRRELLTFKYGAGGYGIFRLSVCYYCISRFFSHRQIKNIIRGLLYGTTI